MTIFDLIAFLGDVTRIPPIIGFELGADVVALILRIRLDVITLLTSFYPIKLIPVP